MEALAAGNRPLALENGFVCLMTLLGIAVGVCVATIAFSLISPVKLHYYKKAKLNLRRRAEKLGRRESGGENTPDSPKS